MFDVKFTDIGEGLHEGKLLKWLVKVGDTVTEGQSLFSVETDKVNAEIPSPTKGVVAELLAKEGEIIFVGNVVVRIDDGKGETAAKTEPKQEKKTEKKQQPQEEENAAVVGALEVSSEVIESSHETVEESDGSKRKVLATPVARKMAKDLGVDINNIKGTGPAGRVMKEDIMKAAQNTGRVQEAAPEYRPAIEVPELKVTGDVERVPLTSLRKAIAKNMALSKSIIPHAAVMDEIDVTELVRLRKDSKAVAEAQGAKLTYMPFIIKAVTTALKEFPIINSSYDEKNQEIILKKFYNIGIAVDTPEGLIVPVLKDADRKGVLQLAKEVEELAEGARSRSLSIDKLQNGTFSITNYGSVGSAFGVPVIKHPEAAILGIGKISKKPAVDGNGNIVVRDMMYLTLCIDHRIIDGADGGRFLARVKQYLENPNLLLLS